MTYFIQRETAYLGSEETGVSIILSSILNDMLLLMQS